MRFLSLLIILFGKVFSFAVKGLNLGNGSTWPGHIALSLNKNFVKQLIAKNKHLKVIFVAGTNGKTTTTKAIEHVLTKEGILSFRNESGANLLNGVASTLIKNSNLLGEINYEVALFETDENSLPLLLREINPNALLILNLFRDQLDRYGEVNLIAKKWEEALGKVPKNTILIFNGDDPELSYLARKSKLDLKGFGLRENLMEKKELSHDVDFIYCPVCKNDLTFNKISYSHLGDFECKKCGFKRQPTATFEKMEKVLPGKYNIYNLSAMALLLETVFRIKIDKICQNLKDFEPAFGRQEKIKYKEKNVMLFLSKNPTGFNQSLETVRGLLGPRDTILFLLNDRIPDGRDVSWIWDVDFENLMKTKNKIFVSGDRAYDMGIRLKYALGYSKQIEVVKELKNAIDKSIDAVDKESVLFIMPTYSAMLDARKIITGKKIL